MRVSLLTIAGLLVTLALAPAASAEAPSSVSVTLNDVALPLGALISEPTQQSCPKQPADANDDSASTTKNTGVQIDVFANDSGFGIAGIGNPDHGTAQEGWNNTIIYTPDTDFVGTDSFYYSVEGCLQGCEGSCAEPDFDVAQVTVTVTE